MAIEVINRGTSANDGTGDNIREAFRKVNDNFDQVLTNDPADYTTATTPLAGTEIALVEQGGTFKKVAVSELGLERLIFDKTQGSYVPLISAGTNVILNSLLIPANTIAQGDSLRIRAFVQKNGSTSGFTIKIFTNTTLNVTGVNSRVIASNNTTTNNRTACPIDRTLVVNASDTTHLRADVIVGYDFGISNPLGFSFSTINWTVDQYLMLTAEGVSPDQARCLFFEVIKN